MKRRDFLYSSAALAFASSTRLRADSAQQQFPESELRSTSYIERTPVPEYHHAPQSTYEAFRDMKFGVRIHWGIYSIWHAAGSRGRCLSMSFADRHQYQQLYRTWKPNRLRRRPMDGPVPGKRHEDVRLHHQTS
jgi:hypothetical protein